MQGKVDPLDNEFPVTRTFKSGNPTAEWTTEVCTPQILQGNVIKKIPVKALTQFHMSMFIFDGRLVVHRVVGRDFQFGAEIYIISNHTEDYEPFIKRQLTQMT